eukprot:3816802-Pyramimonas_sp.AAC.1
MIPPPGAIPWIDTPLAVPLVRFRLAAGCMSCRRPSRCHPPTRSAQSTGEMTVTGETEPLSTIKLSKAANPSRHMP